MPRQNGRITWSDDKLRRSIAEFGPKVDGYIHAVMAYQRSKLVGAMKTTAPWTDRTGNARNGLDGEVDWKPMVSHAIVLFHRVTYGIFLEVRWAGKYAVIVPTIRVGGPDTMRLLSKLFRKLKTQGLVP